MNRVRGKSGTRPRAGGSAHVVPSSSRCRTSVDALRRSLCQPLGEPDRAVLAAGAADRHRQVAALVGLERGQPAAQERLHLRQHVDHLGLAFEISGDGGVAAGERAQLANVVRIRQDADVEHIVGVERHAVPVGEALETTDRLSGP